MTGTTPPAPAQRQPAVLPAGRGHLPNANATSPARLVRMPRWHSAVTYHFGPPLAVAAWPVLLRAHLRHPARRRQALAAVGGGFLIAMAAVGIAAAAHWLRGPTLIGVGGVPAEEVVLAMVAAACGWRVAERRRRAWFLPAEPSRDDPAQVPPAEPDP